MNPTLRDVIRDAIDRQNDGVSPPATLAQTVLDRHRRQVTRRSVLGGAVALAGAAVATPVVLSRREPAVLPWRGRNLVVTAMGPVRIDADPTAYVSLLLNNRTGEYEEIPYVVVPSPDGRLAVVGTFGSELIGVLDRATGQVRWMGRDTRMVGDVHRASWASDSSRFVLTEWQTVAVGGPHTVQAIVVDAATAASRVVPVPAAASMMQAIGAFVWAPGGDTLMADALGDLDPGINRAEVIGIAEFDLTGRHLRTLPVRGALATNAQFSSDGSRIAVLSTDTAPGGSVRIVDRSTGDVTGGGITTPSGMRQIVGWYDADHLVVAAYRPPGRPPVYDLKVVRIADGGVVHTLTLPRAREHYWAIFLAPASGLPDAARKHAF